LLIFAKRNLDPFAFGNIAIGFEHEVVAEQLHTALDEDFAAIFADVTQLARPVPSIAKAREQVREIDRKVRLQ